MKATQIENLELEINLNYYEKLNRLLMEEYKSLEKQLNEHMIDPGVDQELTQVDEEEIDPEQTQEEMEELKKVLQESGIHFDEEDENERKLEDEEAESRYAGMEQSALTQPSQVLSVDVSLDEDDEEEIREKTPEKLKKNNDQIHFSDHGLPPMPSNRQSALKKPSDRDTNMGRDSQAIQNRESQPFKEEERPFTGQSNRPSTAHQIVSKNDMINEMNLLNTVDKSKLNFDNEVSNFNLERNSTIRGDRRQKKTQWNLTICWGKSSEFTMGSFIQRVRHALKAKFR